MSDYAPLHNSAEADGIYAFMKVLPNVPEVAVFDTSFHQSLDPVQYLYSIPYKYYEKFRAKNMVHTVLLRAMYHVALLIF